MWVPGVLRRHPGVEFGTRVWNFDPRVQTRCYISAPGTNARVQADHTRAQPYHTRAGQGGGALQRLRGALAAKTGHSAPVMADPAPAAGSSDAPRFGLPSLLCRGLLTASIKGDARTSLEYSWLPGGDAAASPRPVVVLPAPAEPQVGSGLCSGCVWFHQPIRIWLPSGPLPSLRSGGGNIRIG